MATTTLRRSNNRMTNALWTLIEPQERGVKLQLAQLINESIADSEPTSEMSKEEILSSIEQSCKEAKLIKEGKLKAVSVEELMDEL